MRTLPLTVMLLALCASAALAQTRYVRSSDPTTDVCLFWTTRDVSWWLNEAGSDDVAFGDLEAALIQSFDAWERESCSDLGFTYEGPTDRIDIGFDPASDDNRNLLVWREERCSQVVPNNDSCWNAGDCSSRYGCWSISGTVIALTTTSYNRNTGVIVDSDIEFNGSGHTYTVVDAPPCAGPVQANCVATDVRNTATHEIGHLVGFDHSSDSQATMFATAPPGETRKRELAATDVAGLCAVYPAGDRVATCTPSGVITIRQAGTESRGGCSCGTTGVGALAVLPLLVVIRRRRVRAV